jgi:hypothetical protein
MGFHMFNLNPTPNDVRSTLTWSGRLASLQNASVYNFYSSSETSVLKYLVTLSLQTCHFWQILPSIS